MNKLLKATALALVLAFGSIGGMVWASAGSQPGSPLYPVRMAVENMTADKVTETKPQIEFAQEQADEMQRLADDGQDYDCPGDDCDRDRDRDRDGTCDGDDYDPARDRNRDRDGSCEGGDGEQAQARDEHAPSYGRGGERGEPGRDPGECTHHAPHGIPGTEIGRTRFGQVPTFRYRPPSLRRSSRVSITRVT